MNIYNPDEVNDNEMLTLSEASYIGDPLTEAEQLQEVIDLWGDTDEVEWEDPIADEEALFMEPIDD